MNFDNFITTKLPSDWSSLQEKNQIMPKIKKNLKTLTIVREKWGTQHLLCEDGKMCCLGFACKALGYNLKKLMEEKEGQPLDMPNQIPNFKGPEWMIGFDGDSAAEANDGLYDEEREEEVKRIFAKHGIKVRFK
jgi:hypothetical protein